MFMEYIFKIIENLSYIYLLTNSLIIDLIIDNTVGLWSCGLVELQKWIEHNLGRL